MNAAVRMLLCLIWMVPAFGGPASASEARLAVGEFVSGGEETDLLAAGIVDILFTALEAEIETMNGRRECNITLVDAGHTLRDALAVEKMLQDKGYSQKDGLNLGPVVVTHMVHGAIGIRDGMLDYVIQVAGPGERTVLQVEDSTAAGDLGAAADHIAQQIVEKMCAGKSFHLTASYNDLTLDDLVCDVSQPFGMNGKGQAAGIRFEFIPDLAGGTFTVAGKAAGVLWSGGGTYKLDPDAPQGAFDITGSWKITSPMGVFSDSGTIPGKAAAVADCG